MLFLVRVCCRILNVIKNVIQLSLIQQKKNDLQREIKVLPEVIRQES